jgi:hypothetical protein
MASESVCAVCGAHSQRLCVNCHLKIYNEESIEKAERPFFCRALFSHITKHSIEVVRRGCCCQYLLWFHSHFSLQIPSPLCRLRVCAITSLSLNRKTIDVVNLFHKLSSHKLFALCSRLMRTTGERTRD